MNRRHEICSFCGCKDKAKKTTPAVAAGIASAPLTVLDLWSRVVAGAGRRIHRYPRPNTAVAVGPTPCFFGGKEPYAIHRRRLSGGTFASGVTTSLKLAKIQGLGWDDFLGLLDKTHPKFKPMPLFDHLEDD